MKIEMEHVTKKLRASTVLQDITYTFEGGKTYGLQGKNGSGKTMLIRAVCGLITLTSGRILHDGQEIGRDLEFPPSVGLLLEGPSFLGEYSGKENLKQIASLRRRVSEEQIEDAIREVGLDPADPKRYRKYSLGMKQRLGIAAAIMENPSLLILDEPTNALDTEGVQLIRRILSARRAKDRIILIASHDKEEMEALADEVLVLEAGRLIQVRRPREENVNA